MLSHVLLFTGPANVKISSFSISEAAIRSFHNDINSGLIKSIKLLFDTSIPGRKFDLMLYANEVFSDIRLTANHSKVVCVDGDIHKVAIISSQNLTPNPRIECGCIFSKPELYDYFSSMFDLFFSTAIPFNAQIYES